jgi:hypothetical protein
MTFALTLAAIRRHPFSLSLTLLLVALTASLFRVPAALALAGWLASTLLMLELWYAVEPVALRWIAGCRIPTNAEQQRVEAALGRPPLTLLVADTGDLVAARGLRCLVIGRDLTDLFEDRALEGYLNQVASPLHAADLAGFAIVWLGNVPLVGAALITRLIGQLGRLLAVVVGSSLVVPLVLWREGFVRWVGRLLGSIGVGLVAAILLENGYPAIGFLLMVAWLAVPCLNALVAWESRRTERAADQAAIEAGYGPQLLEATELLALANVEAAAGSVFRFLRRPPAAVAERSRWLRRTLHGWAAAS